MPITLSPASRVVGSPTGVASRLAKARAILDRIARKLAIPWRLRCTAAQARRLVHAIGDAAGTAMRKVANAFTQKLIGPGTPVGVQAGAAPTAANPAVTRDDVTRWILDCLAILSPHHLAGAWAILRATPAAAGGLPPDGVPDDAVLAEVDAAIAAQRSYLARFAAQVLAGRLPLVIDGVPAPGFAARAASYGSAVWGTAERVRRAVGLAVGLHGERRILSAGHACRDCRAEAAKGWVRIGTLRAIGDSVCQSRCRCYFMLK